MLPDPLTVTYDGSAKSLPRVAIAAGLSVYRTADSELEIQISHSFTAEGRKRHSVKLSRRMPDPTPLDVFDSFREVVNSYELTWETDPNGKDSSAVANIQSALSTLADATFRSRMLGGEG